MLSFLFTLVMPPLKKLTLREPVNLSFIRFVINSTNHFNDNTSVQSLVICLLDTFIRRTAYNQVKKNFLTLCQRGYSRGSQNHCLPAGPLAPDLALDSIRTSDT